MDTNKPRVSVGMPVFNGEKYLEETIDSILVQTFTDFELIISDNASTDRTQQICLDYARRDRRVCYYRNEKNLGGPNNYNRVFELSSGEYFKWAAYDDLIAPEYLRMCVNVLDKNPSIIGCHCKTGRIDQNGILVGYFNEELLKRIDSPKRHERFRDLIGLYYTTTPFHGVYRARLLARSQRHGNYIGADRNLLAELSLMGRIYEIPECLFFWRVHPSSYTSKFYGHDPVNTLNRLQMETNWWSKKNTTYFPHWKNCVEYFRSVNRVPLSWYERFLCYAQIFGWFVEEGRRFMAKDIILFMSHNSNLASKLIQKSPLSLKRIIRLLTRK
ncbi:MAG: glycosyltransferase family 2 protein [Candidatus Bathyarchaeota archaeon]|nr:glycosyltransferase family 2 protein [Candidatus Bathyarchaeota archaeon]